ncbi:hypothetical protein ACSU6B_14790 [Neobacillus sp. C211]|uniref:hypothetical protein n=1 Tax=unclassified Neobacillus TaxID=2675272 RepID=UPI00397D87FD
MEGINRQGILFRLLFLTMTYFFARGYYTPFFVFLIALLLLVAFFKEDKRLFAWMVISFFLGNLLLVNMDNLESFRLTPYSLVMSSQLFY